jgi:hypothetical protein
MTPQDETAVREFLAPLRTLPPVTRRPAGTRRPRRRGIELAQMVAVAVVAFALVGVIAFIAHGHRQPPQATGKAPNRYAHLRGWIAIDSNPVEAFDPAHPGRTATLAPLSGFPLSWSRNRSELLVLKGVGPSGGLDVVRGDGTIVEVVHGDTQGGSLTPDGKSVIYSADGRIFEVSANGGTPRLLTHHGPKANDLFAYFSGQQLSPDGSVFAFMGYRVTPGKSGMWLASRDGSNAHVILSTARAAAFTGYPDLYEISELAWFPDSRRLLVLALNQRETHCAVLAVNRDGSDLRRWGPHGGFCPTQGAVEVGGDRFAFTGIKKGYIATADLDGGSLRFIKIPVKSSGKTIAWAPR